MLLGRVDHRPAKAAAHYREGLAPLVLLGTSDSDPSLGYDETGVTRDVLIGLGVPPEAIRVLPGAVTSTREEALRVREFARSHPLRRVTVVTSAFHTARRGGSSGRSWPGRGSTCGWPPPASRATTRRIGSGRTRGWSDYVSEAIKTLYYWVAY